MDTPSGHAAGGGLSATVAAEVFLAAELTPIETNGWHVAAFAETYCRQSIGRWAGLPLTLEPWQRSFLDEAFRIDEDGQRVYRTVLLGIPRKNGKSTLAAAIALYLAVADGENGPQVVLAAGSREQAGIVYEQAKLFVEADVDLQAWLDARKTSITLREGSGFVKRIAADGRLNHGLNPSGIVADELHAFTTPRQEENWSALTTGDAAREEPFTLVITTAGHDKDTILGRLYDALMSRPSALREQRPGLTIVRDPAAGVLLYWYGLNAEQDDLTDPEVVKLANPASWVTVDYLRRKMLDPAVSDSDFARLHANAWTKSAQVWLPTFPGLARRGLRPPDGASVYLAVDAALKNDTLAVACAWRVDEQTVGVIASRVFSANPLARAHVYFDGGRMKWREVEDYIERLAERWNVVGLAYDPRYFDQSADRLSEQGLDVIVMEQNSATMAVAYQEWFRGVTDGEVAHDGDEVFEDHVASTTARMTERGWRVDKLKNTKKIDALVAAAMAHHWARKGEPVNPYKTRGLRFV